MMSGEEVEDEGGTAGHSEGAGGTTARRGDHREDSAPPPPYRQGEMARGLDAGSALVMDKGSSAVVTDAEEEDNAEEDGPPPMALQKQPSVSRRRGHGPPERSASYASVSSLESVVSGGTASSSASATASASKPVVYASARELFHPTNIGGGDNNATTTIIIPVPQLRKLATAGSLDSSHRGVSWRILLGYLSPDMSEWPSCVDPKRELYHDFCRDLFVRPVDSGQQLKQQPRRPRQRRHQPLDDSESSVGSLALSSSLHPPEAATADTGEGSPPPISRQSPPHEIPGALHEAWKKSGRDPHVLESVCSGINALRIPTAPPQTKIDSDDGDAARHYDGFIATASLLDEIRKDVVRTFGDLSFYLDPALGYRRYAALERMLLVHATCSNRAVRYVQGMNEIVAVLYFVLTAPDEEEEDEEDNMTNQVDDHEYEEGPATGGEPSENEGSGSDSLSDVALDNAKREGEGETTIDWADHAESDAYWLFHSLLSEMSDVFVPDMDRAETGIQGRISAMQDLLKRHDAETAEHLEEIGIDAGFYAVRWWTTLLSREFLLPDTVRLWDSMFASTHKDNFIRYVCVTMVLVIRDSLLKADFSTCLRMLQTYPPPNMEQLLQSSRALWIYESQITVACHRGGISLHQALQTIAPPPGIVFAFGLRNGIIHRPQPEAEPSTKNSASEQRVRDAEQKVREATQAVASQAQVFLGRARGLYSRSMLEYRKYRTASMTSNNSDTQRSSSGNNDGGGEPASYAGDASAAAEPELPPDNPEDSIYMEAILKA